MARSPTGGDDRGSSMFMVELSGNDLGSWGDVDIQQPRPWEWLNLQGTREVGG